MDDLIEKNMGLVVSVVNSFKPRNQTEREDYVQAGRIGLWKALKKYDRSKGAVLSTYAWNPIRWEIIKEIKSIKRARHVGKIAVSHLPSLENLGGTAYNNPEEIWESLPSSISKEETDFIELRRMGYKLSEMADISGRKISYVKRIFYRAIKKIRDANV